MPTMFTVYNALTGEVIRVGTCPSADHVAMQPDPDESDEAVIEGKYPSDQFTIVNGVPTPKE